MFVALLACSEAPSAAPPPAPPPTAPPPKAPPAALKCCDTPAATEIVRTYLAVNTALAADQPGDAELTAFTAALAGDPSLVVDAASLAGKPLKERREALKPLSPSLIAYARAHAGGELAVREAFCPMVSAGWLQAGDVIQNPYYGSEMLTCGSFR